jgi:hypothetical protein
MAKLVAIICHIEKLYPHEDPASEGLSGYSRFSLNLSAAFVRQGEVSDPSFDPPVAADLDFLLPWDWQRDGLRLWKQLANGNGEEIPLETAATDMGFQIEEYPDAAEDETALRNAVKSHMEFLSKNHGVFQASRLLWDPRSGPEQGADDDKNIRNFLAYTSTLSAPILRSLGQTIYFKVRRSALSDHQSLFAAPKFASGGVLGARSPLIPALLPPAANPDIAISPDTMPRGSIYYWNYNSMADKPEVRAYLLPWVIAAPAPSSAGRYIDLQNYWIKRSDDARWHGEDWTTKLESKIAGAFDLPQRLIDALREMLASSDEDLKDLVRVSLPAYRKAFLASLRDLADVGLRKPPDAESLFDYLMSRAKASVEAKELMGKALKEYEDNLTLIDWRLLIGKTLPEIASTTAMRAADSLADVSSASAANAERPFFQLADELAELEHIQSAFADHVSLQKLFIAQWDAAVYTFKNQLIKQQEAIINDASRSVIDHQTAEESKSKALEDKKNLEDFWLRCRSTITEQTLPVIELRRRQAAGNIGDGWMRIVARPNGADSELFLRDTFPNEFLHYFNSRFAEVSITPDAYLKYQPRANFPNAPRLHQEVARHLNDFAVRFVKEHVLPGTVANADEGEDSPTEVPHSLTLQVDRIDALSTEDLEDFLRRIAGIGVLMRQKAGETYGDWRCLNMAKAGIKLSASTETYRDVLSVALVPHRLSYINQLRRTFVSYNNHPLIAETPLAKIPDLTLAPAREEDRREEDSEEFGSLLKYELVEQTAASPAKQWARLPGLKFGQTYQIASFAIGNSSVLPKEMTANHPAKMRDLPLPDRAVPLDSIYTVRYLRRVRIGKIRFPKTDKLILPAIPENVLPLSHDLVQDAISRDPGTVNNGIADNRVYYLDEVNRSGLFTPKEREWEVTVEEIDASRFATLNNRIYEIAIVGTTAESTTAAIQFQLMVRHEKQGNDEILFVKRGGLTDAPEYSISLGSSLYRYGLKLKLKNIKNPQGVVTDKKISLDYRNRRLEWLPIPGAEWSVGTQFALKDTHIALAFPPATSISGSLAFAPPKAQIEFDSVADAAPEIPLLLLPNPSLLNQNDFSFDLLPPATDINTWDRWMTREEDLLASPLAEHPVKALRREVWAQYLRHAPKPDRPSAEDLSIDDPALGKLSIGSDSQLHFEKFFHVELIVINSLDPQAWNGLEKSRNVKILPSTIANSFLRKVQSQPVRVNISKVNILTGGSREFSVTDGVVNLKLGAGDIVELRVYAPVNTKFFGDPSHKRFHSTVSEYKPKTLYLGEEYYLFSPWRMMIEGAVKFSELPGHEDFGKDLWQALQPDYTHQNSSAETRAVVQLNRTLLDSAANKKFDYLNQIDLQRQMWRWQGRQLSPFPFAKASNPSSPAQNRLDEFPRVSTPPVSGDDRPETNAFLWDAEGFGDRRDSDHLLVSTSVKASEQNPQIFVEDVSKDPRALYYRFTAKAYSRYRGIFNDSVEAFGGTGGPGQQPYTQWRRLLVKGRLNRDVPKPLIKLVIPLTQAERGTAADSANPPKSPGFLVLLNEAWHEIGGLAEAPLQAEVMEIPFGTVSKPEIGPDPILSGAAWTGNALRFEAKGLIGHTFDTTDEAPLFVASSFILEPVEPPHNLAWHFAKLRFRRALHSSGMHLPTPSAPAEASDSDFELSEFTDNYWVQLLPDFSTFQVRQESGAELPVRANELIIKLVKSESPITSFRLLHADAAIEFVASTQANSKNRFSYWLVLTRLISDVYGQERGNERYIGLYEMKDDKVFRPIHFYSTDADRKIEQEWKLCARVIEVQERNPSSATAWDKIFPPNGQRLPEPSDAEARIVRVSEPIKGRK